MKYKVGDKVKIKTWEDMENRSVIHPSHPAHPNSLKYLNNRIIKIHYVVDEYCYREKGSPWNWTKQMIGSLVKPDPILSRFEILDL